MTVLLLLVTVLLLLGNAFFVGAEFAVLSVRRSQIEPLAEESKRARTVLEGLSSLSLMLPGAQLGVTLCSLGLGAIAEPAVAHLLEGGLEHAHVPEAFLHPISLAVALTLVVFLHTVLGEMVPKNVAIATPERTALLLVPPLVRFSHAVAPLLRLLSAMAYAGLRLLRVEPKNELTSSYTPDELADIIAESRSEGLLDPDEHERLSGALALRQTSARNVMVPLSDLVTVPQTITADELEELVVITGFSRFPVRSAMDDPGTEGVAEGGLVGFVHVKDTLGMPAAARLRPMPASLRRPMPELAADLPLEDVLATLQRNRSHLAQVVDGRGAIGVIALEDVVEEFVGEVEDATNPLNAPALPG